MASCDRRPLTDFAIAAGLLVLLLPVFLAEPIFEPPSIQNHASPVPELAKAIEAVKSPRLKSHAVLPLDREGFLASFARQAGEKLVPCLRTEQGVSGQVTFLGRMSAQGNLKGLRLLEPLKPASPCVRESISSMEFHQITSPMAEDSVEIEWSFAW
jgi:hypothetical protein